MHPLSRVPESADVAIIGGGLAGLCVAAMLAECDARVVVLERMPSGSRGFSAHTHGAVGMGYADHPIRLVRSLGEDVARELVQCSSESLALLRERGWLEGPGLLTASLGATEHDEIGLSIELLERWGLTVEPWSDVRVGETLGGTARVGMVRPTGRLARPDHCGGQSPGWATQVEAQVVHGAVVSHTRDGRPETVVCGSVFDAPFELKADIVVHAAGIAERELIHSSSTSCFRCDFRCSVCSCRTPPRPPFCAQLSYLQCAPRPDGTVVLGGCRWATPHLETGESDPEALSDAVDEKLTAVRTGLLKECLGESRVIGRAAGIMTFTCDGLPIVGPLPGRVGHLACLGWNGRPWSHALRAAAAIRDGLMTGRSTGWPELLTPQRFV